MSEFNKEFDLDRAKAHSDEELSMIEVLIQTNLTALITLVQSFVNSMLTDTRIDDDKREIMVAEGADFLATSGLAISTMLLVIPKNPEVTRWFKDALKYLCCSTIIAVGDNLPPEKLGQFKAAREKLKKEFDSPPAEMEGFPYSIKDPSKLN